MREVRMTFGEHLEELRRRIIVALLWLVASTIICFSFHKPLLELSMRPHRQAVRAAMTKRHFVVIERTVRRLEALMREPHSWEALFTDEIRDAAVRSEVGVLFDDLARDIGPQVPVANRAALQGLVRTFGQRLSGALMNLFSPDILPVNARGYPDRFRALAEDLRQVVDRFRPTRFQQLLGLGLDVDTVVAPLETFVRFIDGRREQILQSPPTLADLQTIVARATIVKELGEIYDELARRLDALQSREVRPINLIKYTEAFMTSFKVAVIFGILFALPFILYEMWKFVGAGLYENEQKYVLIFFPFSMGLFLAGAFFGYTWMVPFGLQFLAGWGAEFAELNFTLENYIGLFFTLTIVLGLVFQTPLVMLFLFKIGLVSSAGFARARKYMLLGAVIFSTLVTPPDPLSWSLMAGPIMLLYELGIRICRFLEKRQAAA